MRDRFVIALSDRLIFALVNIVVIDFILKILVFFGDDFI
jgi:hypothetical protein